MSDRVRVDLHVHSALSPCAAADMRPPAILLTAEQLGVALLGIVDHGTARNAWAFHEAAEAFAVRVFVGLEIESAEGVHLLGLFDNPEAALDMDRIVAAHLPSRPNRRDILGPQFLLDEWGNVLGEDDRLLIAGTDLGIACIARMITERDGLAMPAHIDRTANGLLPTLGFLPADLQVPLLELSRHTTAASARTTWPWLGQAPLVRSSDAHYLYEIGSAVTWVPEELARASGTAREFAEGLARELSAERDLEL